MLGSREIANMAAAVVLHSLEPEIQANAVEVDKTVEMQTAIVCRMTREKDVQFPSCPPLSKGWMWVEGGGLAADGAVALALWQVNHLRMVGLLSLEWDIFEWFPM